MRFDRQAFTVVPANPLLWLLNSKVLTHEELLTEYQRRYGLKERTLSEHLNEANLYLEIKFDGKRRLYTVKAGCHPSLIWHYKDAEE